MTSNFKYQICDFLFIKGLLILWYATSVCLEYIYIYIYSNKHFLLEAIFSILQKAPMGMHVAPQVNFTLAIPVTYVTNTGTVFSIDIKPGPSHSFSNQQQTYMLSHRINTNYL